MTDLKTELKQPEPELTLEAEKAVRSYVFKLATGVFVIMALLSGAAGYLVKELIEKNAIADVNKQMQPTLDTLHEQIGSTRKEVEQYKEAIAAAKADIENTRKITISAQAEVEKYKDAIATAKADIEESRKVANNAKVNAGVAKDAVDAAHDSTKKTLAEMEALKLELQSLRDVYKNLKEFKEIKEAVVTTLSNDAELKKSISDIASAQEKEAIKSLEAKFYSKTSYPTLELFGTLQAFKERSEVGFGEETIYSLRGKSFLLNGLRIEGDIQHVKPDYLGTSYTRDSRYTPK